MRYTISSIERHELRYQRRKAKREQKRKEFLKQYDDINLVASLSSLQEAAKNCAKGVKWKESTQRYMSNEFYNIVKTRKMLLQGKDVRGGFICFSVYERGKKRDIKSVHISERVPQKSLCKNVLIPALRHNLIYDNGACLKGKGVLFAQKRCEYHLHQHFKKYGNEGYVLVFDFHHYFDSIPHDQLKELINKNFENKLIRIHSHRFIDAFGDVGLGLGSEICQILAVCYPNSIDHIIKDKYGFKGYGRYNDDGYIISASKEKLREIKEALFNEAAKLGLQLNEKKTQIIKLSKGFRFLKTRYVLTKTGKILKLSWRYSITKQRRKLKKLKNFFDQEIIDIEQVYNGFASWIGYMKRKHAYKTIQSMKNLFYKLFREDTTCLYINRVMML